MIGPDEFLLALHALERSTRVGIWIYDVGEDHLFWSTGTYRIHGLTPGQFTPTVDGVLDLYAQTSRSLFKQAIERALSTGRNWNLDLELIKPDDTRKWVRMASQTQQTDGRVRRIMGCVLDLRAGHGARDQSRKLLEHLKPQLYSDPLTGLPNRLMLESELTARLEQSRIGAASGWLLHLDLDRFRLINETCGNEAGDRLILELASRLRQALQPNDLLTRLGGDKFAVLMAALQRAAAVRRAKALIAMVDSYSFESGRRCFKLSLSVGAVALDVSTGVTDLSTVLRHAETSCQVAKRRGGGRVTLYRSEDVQLASAEDDLVWGKEILLALDENRFELLAQRIVCLDGRNPPSYEMLLRLRQRDGTLALPGVFLPAAHRYGLRAALDRCVIEMVLEQCRNKLFEQYPCGYIAVNLSARSYCDDAFIDFLLSALTSSGVSPEKLRFEITESEALTDMKTAQATVKKLSAKGFRVMLDDFGNGYTAFDYLRRLQVAGLKIDNSYTRALDRDPFNQAVVACICNLCEQLQLELVAEGVEDEATLAKLRQFNMPYAQGWLFHRPEPLLQALAGGVTAPAYIS